MPQLRITTRKRRLNRAQRRIRQSAKPGRSLADELIAERHDPAETHLVADEAQIQVPVVAAGFSHFLHLLSGLQLLIIAHAIFRTSPFLEEGFHLQVIENRFTEWINAT